VYVTGWFDDPPLSSHSTDIFLSKLDSSGTFLWTRTWGGSEYDYGYGVAADGSGTVYVTGVFEGTVDFNPAPIAVDLHSSNGFYDVFLSKFDSSGTFVWARTWGGSSYEDSGSSVDVDGSGNVYVTGVFHGTSVDFNPDPILVDPYSSNGVSDIFLSKFDSFGTFGTFKWARTWGGGHDDGGYGVDVDGSGNVYVTGYFGGTSDFNPDPTTVDPHSSNGKADIFLSKFKPDGSW
jgi:hypothetical protein